MAILNYTTKIPAEKTAGEIQQILGKAGAGAVLLSYNSDGEVAAIAFQYAMNAQVLSFRLPINSDGVYRVLLRSSIEKRYRNEEQARRTAWRIVKDWVEAQMALVEAGQADLVEVFMPYLQDATGNTLYNRLKSGDNRLLLTHDQ